MPYSQTPSQAAYHNDLRRQGVIPPVRGSGTRIFHSHRQSRPSTNRVSKSPLPTQSRRPNKARSMQIQAAQLGDQLSTMSVEANVPINAPTAPLKDRLRSARAQQEVKPQKAALREPFKNYISTRFCQEDICPVKGLHFEGLYLHNGELADRYHGFFGASNPPPDVKEAFDRCQRYEGLAADYDIVRYFCQCHGPFERELCRLDYWER